jgi:signal transduction histidine kinase
VSYLDEKPKQDEGPFLHEERNLLDAIAKEISIIIMRKEAEQVRAKIEEQLRHADRLATVGQLAAGVAHELNEPLGHILGFAQLALKCHGLPEQAKADIGKVLSTSLYAREIVKTLLMFARQIPPQKCRVNVNYIIDEVLSFLDSQCSTVGITVSFDRLGDFPEINADPSQLKQVFVNLVVNAVQAMPDGGKLRIATQKDKRKIRIVIEDTGMGMSRDVSRNIFTPFFTTKPVGVGTGLGLPVAHGIVVSHRGSIKIDSKPGKGTTCTVELPVGSVRNR